MSSQASPDSEAQWELIDGGTSVGTAGPEDGIILVDEELLETARITLERDTDHAPFAITCGVYGSLLHTCRFRLEVEARSAYEAMKPELAAIVRLKSARIANPELVPPQVISDACFQFTKTFR
ncbi:MAG TPA: hypothetical protein VGP73_24520 [Thermoanaerobaculia bacterium]